MKFINQRVQPPPNLILEHVRPPKEVRPLLAMASHPAHPLPHAAPANPLIYFVFL